MIMLRLYFSLLFVLSVSAFAATPNKSTYILPYQNGAEYKLIQGNNGKYGHTGAAEFAFDFLMPVGTEVTAARAGKVVKIQETYSDNTKKPGEENYVLIQHDDGTFARYYHLTKNGVLVEVGGNVLAGDRIGSSGNSGASAGPHLHFDVTTGCSDWGCQTVKVEFANAAENPLREGQSYKALGIGPDSAGDAKAALAVVNQLFTEMAAANPAGILALHTPTSDLAAVFRTKDGKTRFESIDGKKFSEMFTDKTKVMKEEMYDPKVEVSGDWAMVWGRYVFFAGDTLSHCGINQFNLVRIDGAWKIANGASTIDRNDCTEKEKAMKPDPVKWRK